MYLCNVIRCNYRFIYIYILEIDKEEERAIIYIAYIEYIRYIGFFEKIQSTSLFHYRCFLNKIERLDVPIFSQFFAFLKTKMNDLISEKI